jgi:epoxyqueuosine reductase
MDLAQEIAGKAAELGFEGVGAASVADLAGYAVRVDERERKVPLWPGAYDFMRGLAGPGRRFPEARTVLAGVLDIGRYRVPGVASGLIGRHYLFDSRRNPASPERRMIEGFSGFLKRLGMKALHDEHPGVAPMRWAAWKAGLGTVRRNNFFYTGTGSWKFIAAWAVDSELEMPAGPPPDPCPEGCGECSRACPTGSLSGPYVMDMSSCVSFLTSMGPVPADEGACRRMGGWLYGCDACQDACPFNRRLPQGTEDFPGADAIAEKARPERILSMSEGEIGRELAGKFFYIGEGALWRWKMNALNVIANSGRADLRGSVLGALSDPRPEVRRKASWALARLDGA